MTFAGSLARLCWCWPWLLFSVLRWCFEWAERILRFHRYHGYENGKTRRWRQYFRTAAVVLRVDSFSGAHGCVFGMQATYVILLRYTLRIHVLSGVMEVWFPAFGCEKYLFCAKMAIWNRLFCACCTLDATIFNTFPSVTVVTVLETSPVKRKMTTVWIRGSIPCKTKLISPGISIVSVARPID